MPSTSRRGGSVFAWITTPSRPVVRFRVGQSSSHRQPTGAIDTENDHPSTASWPMGQEVVQPTRFGVTTTPGGCKNFWSGTQGDDSKPQHRHDDDEGRNHDDDKLHPESDGATTPTHTVDAHHRRTRSHHRARELAGGRRCERCHRERRGPDHGGSSPDGQPGQLDAERSERSGRLDLADRQHGRRRRHIHQRRRLRSEWRNGVPPFLHRCIRCDHRTRRPDLQSELERTGRSCHPGRRWHLDLHRW